MMGGHFKVSEHSEKNKKHLVTTQFSVLTCMLHSVDQFAIDLESLNKRSDNM